jgi:hypothetical protein
MKAKDSKRGTRSAREIIVCTPKSLPQGKLVSAARVATEVNPVNRAPVERMAGLIRGFAPKPQYIAVMTTRYWGPAGVRLTVSFMDGAPKTLRTRILSHMNQWAKSANVRFDESNVDPQVRIARTPGDGYWSYLGTDVLSIDKSKPTMNLDSFSMNTPESEYKRVVRHETGHTLGFPHEHMRRQLVAKIDVAKAIAYFRQTQGWDANEVRRQVLTPLEESSIRGTADADPNSIMCYQIPGIITKDGKPIIGGRDIDASDYAFVGKIYPKSAGARPPKAPSRATVRRFAKKIK